MLSPLSYALLLTAILEVEMKKQDGLGKPAIL